MGDAKFENCVAVVTGAASGIGRALAYRLADAGARVAISDIDEAGLEETRAECVRRGAEAHAQRLDVADREAFEAYAEAVANHFGAVNLVINNAGVALEGRIEDLSYENFEWLMGINFWGVVYGTKAFLPHLKRAEWGHVVNISSIFGVIGVPGQGAYNAAKFAVRGFTEALRQELDLDGGRVSATSVHPGGIATNIVRNSRLTGGRTTRGQSKAQMQNEFAKLARTTPDEAARVILDGVQRNSRRTLIGLDARIMDRLQRWLPSGYQRLVTRFANRRSKSH